jgi:hypothetical protein
MANNAALPGGGVNSGFAYGGGVFSTNETGSVANSILAFNEPENLFGTLFDLGSNLSSDSSCNFIELGSANDVDPLLGPLANNGGGTLTFELLPGSPAIDNAEPTVCPPTDQRGLPRPVGAGCDIGAYERQ